MSVDYCPICREMVWNCGPHRCPPRWDTAIPDEDEDIDDGHVIRARTAEDATRRMPSTAAHHCRWSSRPWGTRRCARRASTPTPDPMTGRLDTW